MQTFNAFMEGKKVWVGLLVITLGWLGAGEIVSSDQVAQAIDLIFQGVGLIVAIYGNIRSHSKIKELGGYSRM